MTVTDIYEAMNSKAETFSSGCRLTRNTGCCLVSGCLPYGLQGCCSVGNGHVIGSLTANCGYLTIASLKHAAGFRLCWSAF